MISPDACREIRLAVHVLQGAGRVSPDEVNEVEAAIESAGRNRSNSCEGANAALKKLMTRKQVAELLGVSRRTVVRMEKAGLIRSMKVGVRLVRFRAEDIEALTADKASAA